MIICHPNGAAERRPQNSGYSSPLLWPQLCRAETQTHWVQFRLLFCSLNSCYGRKHHNDRLESWHCDFNTRSDSETSACIKAVKDLDDQALTQDLWVHDTMVWNFVITFNPQKAGEVQIYNLELSLFIFAASEQETESDQTKMPFNEYRSWIPLMSSQKDKTAIFY